MTKFAKIDNDVCIDSASISYKKQRLSNILTRSTKEHVVGYLNDETPIYEITVFGKMTGNSGAEASITIPSDIKAVIAYSGTINNYYTESIPLGTTLVDYNKGDKNIMTKFLLSQTTWNPNKVYIVVRDNSLANYDVIVTLQYIK